MSAEKTARSGARSWRSLQDRLRDASLSVVLVLQLSIVFLAAPLAAKGLPLAQDIVDILTWIMVVVVVLLSRRPGAIIALFAGLVLLSAKFSPVAAWSATVSSGLGSGGRMIGFAALSWVVAQAVFAPGRITSQRMQGAVVVYLNLAIIFETAYQLIVELEPAAFNNIGDRHGDFGTLLYFSLTTLTTTGYGDITPVDPFARGLANLEAVLGQFYLAITIARLVSLQVAGRRG